MLWLALISLFTGPLIYRLAQRRRLLAAHVDRLIAFVLAVIVVILVLPELFGRVGFTALALIAAGYLFPALLETLVRNAARTMHFASLMLALAGLLLHAALDGAGLAGASHPDGVSSAGLAWAIVLHRLGMGVMLWMIVQSAFGATLAWFALATVAAATVAGHLFSEVPAAVVRHAGGGRHPGHCVGDDCSQPRAPGAYAQPSHR